MELLQKLLNWHNGEYKVMEKPTSLLLHEFKDNIVKTVNESKLPMFVMEPILRDLYISVKNEAERVYLLEKQKYEESLKKSDGKEVD